MAKVKIGNIVKDSLKPKLVNGKHILYASKIAFILPEQITEVNIGCDITIPEGFLGILTPMPHFVDERSIFVEGGGIVTGQFNSVKMRKGIAGSVKIHAEEPIAVLYVIPKEEIEFVYYK